MKQKIGEKKVSFSNETNEGATDGVKNMMRQDEIVNERQKLVKKYEYRIKGYKYRPYSTRTRKHKGRTDAQSFAMMHLLRNVSLTQYNIKQVLKRFGQKGTDAVQVELEQIDARDVMDPKDATTLSKEQKRAALNYLMFLKKKRYGKIKGRGCADGRKQRLYKTKSETSSPTVAIESLMLSCVIDSRKGRDVATCDIPGAFMQANMDDEVYMRIDGKMAELLVKINPNRYKKYLTNENGTPVLYVLIKKALYGTVQAVMLFWQNLIGFLLDDLGFELNPYEWCVANKMIDGNQCTIVWHVDDLKISQVNPDVVTDILSRLEDKYGGEEAPLTVTRGKIHDYLGMVIDYTTPGKVKFSMDQYVEEMLTELPEDMKGTTTSTTPAGLNLFQVREGVKLDPEVAETFHHNVAKLLFLSKRAQPNLQTAVVFLCTRVKGPDEDDYKKLHRVMKYLRGSKEFTLTLEADNLHILKWWVDASFAVHDDTRSHTGGVMSMG